MMCVLTVLLVGESVCDSLTRVVLLVNSSLVVLLPAPTRLAVMSHLLQEVEHSDLTPTSLIIRLTVNNVV